MRTYVVTHRHFKDAAMFVYLSSRANGKQPKEIFWKLQRDWSIQRSPEDERLRVGVRSSCGSIGF